MPWRWYDDEDLAAVKAVLDSGNLGSIGENTVTRRFEAAFRRELEAPYAIAMNSAMSEMHAAIAAAGVGPGDEVICDPMVTFGGISVMYGNGVPVFADVDRATHNIDPDSIAERITERTKAMVVTHLWGLPCEMDRIMALADEHGLVVIEDCAHALFATYQGRYAGTWGHIGTFSFQQSKQMGLGDAGMAVCQRAEHLQIMEEMSTFGTVPKRLGWNYRMNEITAAVGIVQLGRARQYVADTQANGAIYNEAVTDCEWVVAQAAPDGAVNAYHIWAGLFEGDRCGVPYEAFQEACREVGCGVSFGYIQKPAYLHDIFTVPLGPGKGCPTRCPHYEAEPRYEEGLCPVAEDMMPRIMLIYTGQERPAAEENAAKLREAIARFD
jgi:perosamine synthetase